MKRLLLIPIPIWFSACVMQPGVERHEAALKSTEDGDPVYPSMTNFCRSVTVTGKVFYNDLRVHGRFALRADPNGVDGVAEPYGTGDDVNYLGLRDAQVDLYEIDLSYGNGASCFASAFVGTTSVERDGSFSWTGQVCETCGADLDGGNLEDLSIAVKISLRDCSNPTERCHSVRDPQGAGATDHYDDNWDGEVWSRWFDGASDTAPRQTGSTYVSLGTDYFQATGNPTSKAARAANVFAGMVDVTRKVHTQIGVAFGHDEVAAYFPNSIGGLGHSHESGRLCVGDPGAGGWINGKVEPHEYGHLLHYWAWENQGKWVSYCYDHDHDGHTDAAVDADGDGVKTDIDPPWLIESPPDNINECDESYSQEEYANAAFKEGWADFVAGVTYDGTGSAVGCDAIDTGGLLGCPGTVCKTARHYFADVTRVLCDVWDTPGECQVRGSSVYCDSTDETLITMVNDLEDVWVNASQPERDIVIDADASNRAILPTFGLCSFYDELDDANVDLTFAASGLDCGP